MQPPSHPLRIAVAGGSIGGLCAGLALHGTGHDVQIYERLAGPMETRGAGIVVQPELTGLLREYGAGTLPMTSCSVRRYLSPDGGPGQTQRMPQEFTSWEAIYRTLLAAFPAERYHLGAELTHMAPHSDGRGVSAAVGGEIFDVDLMVGADGAQSPTRRRLLPDVRPHYGGYVAWRGTLDERLAPDDLIDFFDDTFTFSEATSGGHILVYFIPGGDADTAPGRRRLNWVWYVGAEEDELARLLVDSDGIRHHASLPIGKVPASTVAALQARAKREVHPKLAELVAATPDPFLQTIVDVAVPRMVFGRICLLGDAAFVVRPHTAGATAKAARDANTLASALKRARQNVDAGLGGFEDTQLEYGRSMVDYGVALGERWASARKRAVATV